jgi:perosamine synthetase
MTFHEYQQSLGGKSYLYANASNGFKDVLDYLRAQSSIKHPKVILPSYVPAKLFRTALAAECSVEFYEVFDKVTFDLAEVEKLIDENTLAVFHVHYFGFPHQTREMRELTRAKSVHLIEDCALTIGASDKGITLGTIGDFSIFSMRKMFLFAEGGFIRHAPEFSNFQPHYEWRVNNCFSMQKYVRQRGKYLYMRLTYGADPLGVIVPDPTGYMDWSTPKQTLHIKQMSQFSTWRLNYANIEKVAKQRRENYAYVSERFPRSANLRPIHDELQDGWVPYSFPLLVNSGRRDEIRSNLLRNGTLSGAGWPESPYVKEQARAKALSSKLLEVPIHQALTRHQIDRSLAILEKYR